MVKTMFIWVLTFFKDVCVAMRYIQLKKADFCYFNFVYMVLIFQIGGNQQIKEVLTLTGTLNQKPQKKYIYPKTAST